MQPVPTPTLNFSTFSMFYTAKTLPFPHPPESTSISSYSGSGVKPQLQNHLCVLCVLCGYQPLRSRGCLRTLRVRLSPNLPFEAKLLRRISPLREIKTSPPNQLSPLQLQLSSPTPTLNSNSPLQLQLSTPTPLISTFYMFYTAQTLKLSNQKPSNSQTLTPSKYAIIFAMKGTVE